MRRPALKSLCLGTLSAIALSTASQAADKVYADFPVTIDGYNGSKTTSVAYTGQVARQALHDSLKKLTGKGDNRDALTLYYSAKDNGRAIIAPVSKDGFPVVQNNLDEISKGKALENKTFGGVVTGMPNGMTGPELIKFWLDKAADSKGGVDMANGYNYPQLVSKFLMGALMYNQAVDQYLDEKLAKTLDVEAPGYKEGAPYSAREHFWDEAFGYFGAPVHMTSLDAKTLYNIAKQKPEALAAADHNKDGKIDLKTEMVFAPTYYAAGADKSGKTDYANTIFNAFYDGRALIAKTGTAAMSKTDQATLKGYIAVIEENWEKTLAEATFKYAGSVFKDLDKLETVLDAGGDTTKVEKAYIKHWSELKGFSLALQAGRQNRGELFARLNRLIGYGPVLSSSSQVVDIDRKGNYLRDEAISFAEYRLHMLKVQKALVDVFDIKGRSNDMLADMAALSDQMKSSGSAEND